MASDRTRPADERDKQQAPEDGANSRTDQQDVPAGPPGEAIEPKAARNRVPSRDRNDRPARWRRQYHLVRLRLARRNPEVPLKEREALAQKEVDELLPDGDDPVFEKHWQSLRPQFPVPEAKNVLGMVVIAASLWLPQMRWLVAYLEECKDGTKTNRARDSVARGRVVAALLYMTFYRCKPSVRHARERVACEKNATLAWAFDWPAKASQKHYPGFLDSVHSVCHRKDPKVVRHLSVEFVRTLSRIPTRRNKGVPCFGICRALVADATGVEADFKQAPFLPDEPGGSVNYSEHADERRGERHKRVRVLTYTDEKGEVRHRVVGYKLLTLICPVLNRPVIEKMILAVGTDVERWQVIELFKELFAWWPECPTEFLIGDSLYAGDHAFIETLYRYWGVFLVAHVPANQVAPEGTDRGVPLCTCRREDGPHLKVPYSWDDFYTPKRREKEGIKRGECAPVPAFRVRWHCPFAKRKGTKFLDKGCGHSTTRSTDHWAFCSYLPHAGEHDLAKLRSALLLSRNRVESSFAALKRLGLAGKGTERAEWADDHEMEWLLGLGSLSLLLTKVIHTKGAAAKGVNAYKEAMKIAKRYGLDEAADGEDDDDNIDADTRQRLRAERDRRFGPATPPETLNDDGTEKTRVPDPDDDSEEVAAPESEEDDDPADGLTLDHEDMDDLI